MSLTMHDNSDGEDARMIVENDSLSSISDELFSEGLNSPVLAKIFFNCLRNIENKVKDLVQFQEETTKNNFKVTEALQSMSDRFDNLEKKYERKG